MKKRLLLTMMSVLLGGAMLASCSSGSNAILSEKGMSKLANQGLSALSLVNQPGTASKVLKRALLANDASTLTEEEISDIKALLGQVDTILANNTGVSTVAIPSTMEEYASGLEVTYQDVLGNVSTYNLFYNESLIEDNDDHDEEHGNENHGSENGNHGSENGHHGQDNGHHGPKRADDSSSIEDESSATSEETSTEEETDMATLLEGVLIEDEDVYNFRATIEEETEEDEVETEVEFYLYNDAGLEIKAKTETEIENEETESKIRYTVSESGTILTTYCLKVEQEEGENPKIKLQMNENSYKIEQYEENEETFFKVRFYNGDSKVKALFQKVVSVNEETGETSIDYVIVE